MREENILDFKNYFKERYFLIAFSAKMKGCVCESKVLPGHRKQYSSVSVRSCHRSCLAAHHRTGQILDMMHQHWYQWSLDGINADSEIRILLTTSLRESSVLLPITLYLFLHDWKLRQRVELLHACIPTISEMQFYTF